MVFLKLHPFRMNVLNDSSLHKLPTHNFGPFKVVKWIGAVARELDLPINTRVHPVVLVSLLKKHVNPAVPGNPTLLPVDDQGQFMLELEEFLGGKLLSIIICLSLKFWFIGNFLILKILGGPFCHQRTVPSLLCWCASFYYHPCGQGCVLGGGICICFAKGLLPFCITIAFYIFAGFALG